MRPTQAFRSPAAMRSTMRSGQPRKMRAPIIMMKPRTNRVMGEEPAVERYSRVARAIRNEPTTRPTISGRKYCTVSVVCSFMEPAMSRMKHAAHMAMLAGLPEKGQKRHSEADQHADQGQALFAIEEIQGSPFLYIKMNRSHSILRRACARAGRGPTGTTRQNAQNAIRNGKQCKPRQCAAKSTPCRMRRMRAESPWQNDRASRICANQWCIVRTQRLRVKGNGR